MSHKENEVSNVNGHRSKNSWKMIWITRKTNTPLHFELKNYYNNNKDKKNFSFFFSKLQSLQDILNRLRYCIILVLLLLSILVVLFTTHYTQHFAIDALQYSNFYASIFTRTLQLSSVQLEVLEGYIEIIHPELQHRRVTFRLLGDGWYCIED